MDQLKRPRRNQELIWRALDDGAVLVSPGEGQVCVLNPVGTQLWELIDGRHSVADLERFLVSHFRLSAEQATLDLRAFLDELTDRGLLQWDP